MSTLPHPGAAGVPSPVYGVIILVVILVCLIFLVRQGYDMASASGAILTVAVATVDITRRLRNPRPDEDQSPDAAN